MKECSKDIEGLLGYLAPLPFTPSQSSLDRAFSQTASVKIFRGGERTERVLLLEVQGEDVKSIRDLLMIEKSRFKPILRGGSPVSVALHKRNGRCITTLGYHYSYSLRRPGWILEGVLKNGSGLQKWLESKGLKT